MEVSGTVGIDIRMIRCTYPVGGEGDVGGAEEASTDHVGKGVVFLVKGEDSSGWHACISNVSRMSHGIWRCTGEYLRVSTSTSILFSPGARRIASYLRYKVSVWIYVDGDARNERSRSRRYDARKQGCDSFGA